MSKRGQVIGRTPFGEARQYTEEELKAIAAENAQKAEEEIDEAPPKQEFWRNFNGWRVGKTDGLLYPVEGNDPAPFEFSFDINALGAGANPLQHATEKTARRVQKLVQRIVSGRVVGRRYVQEFFAYPYWEITIQGADPHNAGGLAADLVFSGFPLFYRKFSDILRMSGVDTNFLTAEEALKDI